MKYKYNYMNKDNDMDIGKDRMDIGKDRRDIGKDRMDIGNDRMDIDKDYNIDTGIEDVDGTNCGDRIDNKTICFPDNVWHMICCYCDDRIERKQRKIMRSIRTIRQFAQGTGQIMITAYIHSFNNGERTKRILNSYLKNSIVWIYTNNKCVSLNEFIANNIG